MFPKRYHHLDVYKGVCMLLIILTHFRWNVAERLKYFFPFWVDMAVPVLMVITGYLYALSFQKKEMSLKVSYQISELIIKWLRFVIPYFPVLFAEMCARKFILHENITVVSVLQSFVVGGYGPGSYYFPVMLQVVVLLPIIIVSIRKYRFRGLVLWFSINVLFEIVKTLIGMGDAIYRLLSLRYLFVLSYGVFLYYSFNRNNVFLYKDSVKQKLELIFAVGGATGLIYLASFNYFGFKPIITAMWTNTSVFAVLWIVPLTYWLFLKVDVKNELLEIFGQASFEIFLVQKVYYWGLVRYVYKLIDNSFLQLMLGLIISLVFGVVYYKIENPIQKKVVSWVKEVNCSRL